MMVTIEKIMHTWAQAINARNLDLFDQVYTSRIITHDLAAGSTGQRSIAEQKEAVRSLWLNAFPDLHVSYEIIMQTESMFGVTLRLSGAQSGPWMGLAPTNKRIAWSATYMARIENDRMAEFWGTQDYYEALQQLGVGFALATT